MNEIDLEYLSKQPENTFKAAQTLAKSVRLNPEKYELIHVRNLIIDAAFKGDTIIEINASHFRTPAEVITDILTKEGFLVWKYLINKLKISWSLKDDN